MTSRQQKLLKYIVQNYIKTAQPIASNLLVEKLQDNISSATIRNEMVALEKAGYISQPHTSSGRIPTEKAYQFFIKNYLDRKKELQIKKLRSTGRAGVKEIAKEIARISGLAVLVAFDKNDTYYTGLSNLFSQPEFEKQAEIVTVSELIDKFDDVLQFIYKNSYDIPEIHVGKRGYFGKNCSFVVVKKSNCLIGILGPLRMDYDKSYALLNITIKFFK
jgi:transcriptional regulator of heat shock response